MAAANPSPQQAVNWSPSSNMDGQLFPSLIIATATVRPDADEKNDPELVGDAYGIVGISVTSPAPHSKARLTLHENLLMNTSSWSGELEKGGTEYYIAPAINYKFDQLRKAHQQVPLNITFDLEVNGKSLGEQHETITVHSINDCPYAVSPPKKPSRMMMTPKRILMKRLKRRKREIPTGGGLGQAIVSDANTHEETTHREATKEETEGGSTDLGWMFAAYVNEGSPSVEKILKEALASKLVNQFAGYQGAPDTL